MVLDYDFRANVTTVLCFVLFPVLAGLGVDSVTSSAVVGVVVALGGYVLLFFNERYLSGFFTMPGYSVVKDKEVKEDGTLIKDDGVVQDSTVKDDGGSIKEDEGDSIKKVSDDVLVLNDEYA